MRRKGIRGAMLLLALGALCAAPSHSQTIEPSSRDEAIRAQQQQREEQRRRDAERTPTVHSPSHGAVMRAPVPDEAPCFVIERIAFDGDLSIAFAWLRAETAPFEGRCLGVRSIQALVMNINDRLLEQGYVTSRASLPEQDLKQGVLRVQLRAGRVEHIVPEVEPGIQPASKNAFPTGPGHVLRVRDLDQAMENLGRLLSRPTQIFIQPGAVPDTSKLRVRTSQERPWRARVSLDDSAPVEYGRSQLQGNVVYDNPLGIGDQWTAALGSSIERVGSERHQRFAALQATVPWGNQLLSVAHNTSNSARRVSGTSVTFLSKVRDERSEIRLRSMIHRDQRLRIFASWSIGERQGRSMLDDVELVVQRRNSRWKELSLGASWTGDQTNIEAGVSAERHWKRTSELIAALVDEPGRYDRYRARLDLHRAINHEAFKGIVSASLDAQQTPHPISNSEPLVIGTRYTVRGYTESQTLAGFEGAVVKLELQSKARRISEKLILSPYFGADFGIVTPIDSATPSPRRLMGAVVGVRISIGKFSADVALSYPLKRFPGMDRRTVVPLVSVSADL